MLTCPPQRQLLLALSEMTSLSFSDSRLRFCSLSAQLTRSCSPVSYTPCGCCSVLIFQCWTSFTAFLPWGMGFSVPFPLQYTLPLLSSS